MTLYQYLISSGTNLLLKATGNTEHSYHTIAINYAQAIMQMEAVGSVDENKSAEEVDISCKIMTEQHVNLDSTRNLVRFFSSRIPCHCLDQKKRENREKLGRCCYKNCEKSALDKSLMTCSKCLIIKYCSRDCQVSDWPEHRKLCRMLANTGKKTADEKKK
jgi:MYND finger